jgi:hypothetical protein
VKNNGILQKGRRQGRWLVPLVGGGSFASMALTLSGSMEVAASGRGTVEPKIQ